MRCTPVRSTEPRRGRMPQNKTGPCGPVSFLRGARRSVCRCGVAAAALEAGTHELLALVALESLGGGVGVAGLHLFLLRHRLGGLGGLGVVVGGVLPPFMQLLMKALYSSPFRPLAWACLAQSPVRCCCGVSGLGWAASAARADAPPSASMSARAMGVANFIDISLGCADHAKVYVGGIAGSRRDAQ